jgi:uncharacterized membrane protein YkvA (DUF1232 family)
VTPEGATGSIFQRLLLPAHVAELVWGVVGDPRVPRRAKLALMGGALYMFSPIDLLPELILGKIGYLDDAFVAIRSLRVLLADTPESIVRDHWAGSRGDLAVLRATLIKADGVASRCVDRVRAALFGAGWAH